MNLCLLVMGVMQDVQVSLATSTTLCKVSLRPRLSKPKETRERYAVAQRDSKPKEISERGMSVFCYDPSLSLSLSRVSQPRNAETGTPGLKQVDPSSLKSSKNAVPETPALGGPAAYPSTRPDGGAAPV